MALINLLNNTISLLKEDVYDNFVTVLSNGDTGYFYVGNVFTPKEMIGKKIIVKFEVVEDC